MIAACPKCGAASEVPADARETACQKCGERFEPAPLDEAATQRRAMFQVLAAVILLFVFLALLLLTPGQSGAWRGAREFVFGSPIANRFGGGNGTADADGDGGGNGANSGERTPGAGRSRGRGSEIPDAEAGDTPENSPDAPIGRAPRNMNARKPGDEIRPGAAGTDDPADRIGNTRRGAETSDASGGANPGNSSRNSVETPDGSDMQTGLSTGENPGGRAGQTNSSSTAYLLDDFSERLRQAGARSGDIQISLEWKNVNDLDLHVIDPGGEEIFYKHRNSASGGHLDVDMNAMQLTWRPVENVYWPERAAPKGKYRVDVVHYANHGSPDPTPFSVRVINKGQVSYFRGYVKYLANPIRSRVTVCQFVVQ